MKLNQIPTYQDCLEMCQVLDSPFYESKMLVNGYNVSIFNYRLAQFSNFKEPIKGREIDAKELRGITFVFNEDGTLYKRFVLLEKFFNLNQVPDTMYSVVKNFKIKYINNKEDGSIASFIKLPNGDVLGRSKMGFTNEQSDGINRVYRNNKDVNKFVNWCLSKDIVPIFEYVAPSNRIVLRYKDEELILLRLRDNKTGVHIDIKDHLDKIGSIKIAPFDDEKTLDELIELSKEDVDKEGWIIQFDNNQLLKIKTQWYIDRHGLLTDDLYREHIIIGYTLDDKIDDILGQVPEDEKEAHIRVNKIISIVKRELDKKESEIIKFYKDFKKSGLSRKEYAIKYNRTPMFSFVMAMANADDLKSMNKSEIFELYDSLSDYEKAIERQSSYELAKTWLRERTKKLQIARDWLINIDKSLFFTDVED